MCLFSAPDAFFAHGKYTVSTKMGKPRFHTKYLPNQKMPPDEIHPCDRKDKYYVSYHSAKGFKLARKRAGIDRAMSDECSYGCCWNQWVIDKSEIEQFPRYLRHGFEYGPESFGFKKFGDPNRKKVWK